MDIQGNKKYRQDFWKGTNQAARLLNELKPDYVQVDELTLSDLVKFTDQYARQVLFHQADSAVEDHENWQDFLMRDYLYLLFFMSGAEVEQMRTEFMDALDSAYRFNGFEYRRQKTQGLVNVILELGLQMSTWYRNMEFNEHTQDLAFALRDVAEKELKPGFAELLPIAYTVLHDTKTEKQIHKLAHGLKLDHTETEGLTQLTDDTLAALNRIFNRWFYVADHLSHEARKTLDRVLNERRDSKSHIALFIAFLKLYKKAQGELNQITRKHLEFYYTRILGQSPDDTLPDQAYLCLTLAKNVNNLTLEKNVCFTAGKGSDGKNLLYGVLENTLLTSAQIKQIHTLYVSKNPLDYTGLSGEQVTDIFYKTDIQLPEQPSGWSPFGEDQFFRGSESKTMENAPVGFVVASEALHLTEGERDILIEFECTPDSYRLFKLMIKEIAENAGERESTTFTKIFLSAFDFSLTLNGGEVAMDRFAIKDCPEKHSLALHVELPPTEEPLIGRTMPSLVPTGKPYVKLLLKPESHIYAYPLIKTLQVTNIAIRTAVKGVKDLNLYNNFGQINPAVPFQVFGASPQMGSYFLIGSSEIFTKRLQDLTLKIKWFQLPQDDGGWAGYFKGYDAGIANGDYKVALSYLKDGSWHPTYVPVEKPIFEETGDEHCLSERTTWSHVPLDKISFSPYVRKPVNPFHNKTRDGYLKLEFTGPKFGFGHADYARKLSEVVLHNAKRKPDSDEPALPEPNPPVAPLIVNVEANYRALTVAFEDDKATHEIDLYRITPFGYREVPLKSPYTAVELLEPFDDEGNLYLGLDTYPTDGYLNLFFHLMEGRVEDYLREIPEPRWQYLANDTWYDFDNTNLISDGTHGFIQSGIVQLQIPPQIEKNNSILGPDLFWIKASVHRGAQIAAGVNGIFTNAVTVQWDAQGSNDHLNQPLPAYSIQKLKDKVTGIQTIVQPLPSFGAKKVEETNFFYQRVSERLRHKHRAVNVWDYERLVLNRFPLLHKVKCFTANTLYIQATPEQQKALVGPGCIKIVVIPDANSPEVRNLLRPKVGISMLAGIQRYLKAIASPFVEIEVMNPFYERIKVIATIKLKPGLLNEGFYVNQLNDDLKSFLTPWLWDKNSDNEFGNSVFESRIMAFVQGLPYIDFVSGFSVIKTWNDDGIVGLTDSARTDSREELKPLYPWSILVSADSHDISIFRKERYLKPEPRGIENMLMGSDFIISE